MLPLSRRLIPVLSAAALLASGSVFTAAAGSDSKAPVPAMPQSPASTESTYEGLGWLPFPLQLELSGMGEFLDDSDAGPAGTVWRGQARLPFLFPLGDRVKILGALSGEYSDFESSPVTDDGLQTWDFSTLAWADVQVTDRWSVLAGGLVTLRFEVGSERNNSWNGGVLGGIGYRFSDTLQVGFGAVGVTRTNDNDTVLPIVQLDWKVSPDFFVRILGLEARAEYRLSDAWSVFAGAEYDPGGGTLKSRRGVAATSFTDDAVRAGVGVTWRCAKAVSLTLDGGVAMHEMRLRDDYDNELAKDSLDAAPYVGVTLVTRF